MTNRIIAVVGGNVLLDSDGHLPECDGISSTFLSGIQLPEIPAFEFDADNFSAHYSVYCLKTEDVILPSDGLKSETIRGSYGSLGDEWKYVAKAAELCNWDAEERFCRTCGKKLFRKSPISKVCDGCGAEWFAPVSPAIMVLVEDNFQRALLVHAAAFRHNFFGLVAGFVETGESLEECVIREVREETGLEISDLNYVASQSWPFPHQLMIGFHARLKGGCLEFIDGELSEGGFFSRDSLPELASYPSLARLIIEKWRRCEL